MNLERYLDEVAHGMDDELAARVREELSEHWYDAQDRESCADPARMFGEAELLGKQLTTAMQPSSRTTDTLLAILLACGTFFHSAVMQETIINSLHLSSLTLIIGVTGVFTGYAILSLALGMFVQHLRITAPKTSFARWAVLLSYTIGTSASITFGLFGRTAFSLHTLAPANLWSVIVTFFLSVLFSVLTYSWAQWFGKLPQSTVQRATSLLLTSGSSALSSSHS
jgi:hypothetical protein